MKTLFLQGYGISIKVVNGKLLITNGKNLSVQDRERKITEVTTTPNFDKVVIEGSSGWIFLEALVMLSVYGVNVIGVDKKGRLSASYNQIGRSGESLLRQKHTD